MMQHIDGSIETGGRPEAASCIFHKNRDTTRARVDVAVGALDRRRLEQRMPAADLEHPVDGLHGELRDVGVIAPEARAVE